MALSVDRTDLPSNDLIARLRAGDQRPLTALYRYHRRAFNEWAQPRFPELCDDDFAEAFQQAVVLFYEQVVSGRLDQLTAAPSTFIFRLAARFCHKSKKSFAGPIKVLPLLDTNSSDNLNSWPEMLPNDPLFTDPYDLALANEARDEQVARALKQLSADCYRLLTGFYYRSQSLAALSEEFEHRDPQVTTVRKSQCLAKLRALCGVSRS